MHSGGPRTSRRRYVGALPLSYQAGARTGFEPATTPLTVEVTVACTAGHHYEVVTPEN